MKKNNELIVIIGFIIILIITMINISSYIDNVIIPSRQADEILKKYISIDSIG